MIVRVHSVGRPRPLSKFSHKICNWEIIWKHVAGYHLRTKQTIMVSRPLNMRRALKLDGDSNHIFAVPSPSISNVKCGDHAESSARGKGGVYYNLLAAVAVVALFVHALSLDDAGGGGGGVVSRSG